MSKRTERSEDGVSRRGLLRAIALALGTGAVPATAEAETGPEPAERSTYRETDHIRRFYEAARF